MITTVTDNRPQSINTALFGLEKEIKNLQLEVQNMNSSLEKINGSEEVISVNGKKGVVSLTYSDVNALPDTTVVPNRTSQLTNDSSFVTSDDIEKVYVPLTRKINNKELRQDITLTYSDVNALSDSTTHLSGDISTTEKASANGVASLDEYGKVPVSQLPSAIMQYKGTWNASTNIPILSDGMTGAEQGDVYVCNVAGAIDLGSGSITFYEGDWVMYNGSIWERSANANLVKSVNGQQGVVELTASDVGALPNTTTTLPPALPDGYIYPQLYNPTTNKWEASPEDLFPGNTWEDITSDWSSYPFFKAGTTTTGSGHNASHSHSMDHKHRMEHTHSISHTHSTSVTAMMSASSGYGGASAGGLKLSNQTKSFTSGGASSGTSGSGAYTGSYFTGNSITTGSSGTSNTGRTSTDSQGSGSYPEPNYSGMRIWRCTGKIDYITNTV